MVKLPSTPWFGKYTAEKTCRGFSFRLQLANLFLPQPDHKLAVWSKLIADFRYIHYTIVSSICNLAMEIIYKLGVHCRFLAYSPKKKTSKSHSYREALNCSTPTRGERPVIGVKMNIGRLSNRKSDKRNFATSKNCAKMMGSVWRYSAFHPFF